MGFTSFNEGEVLYKLKHYLPTQAPLKDFVHHNTLHAFQDQRFGKAIWDAANIFGYKVTLSLKEFRDLYQQEKISKEVLERIVARRKFEDQKDRWFSLLTEKNYDLTQPKKIGLLRQYWKEWYHLDLDTIVHTNLFRILNSYLDQGIAISKFPGGKSSFLASIREIEKNSLVSFFKTDKGLNLLHNEDLKLTNLLDMLVGDDRLYEQYLFDQQFAHPGWSGLVAVLENQPETLLDRRNISLHDFIYLELLLELDTLEKNFGKKWEPLAKRGGIKPQNIFEYHPLTELNEVLNIWQEAMEWTFFDQVLAGIKSQDNQTGERDDPPLFQTYFCIDDRECSVRRYIESLEPACETYATPGHFGVDAFYQPVQGKFYTKICPGPIQPNHIIKEVAAKKRQEKDNHFTARTHHLLYGWLISQSLGFWSAIDLMFSIFKPRLTPASSSSFKHMDEFSTLTVENRSERHKEGNLQIGYTVSEMTDRVEGVLKSTGLVKNFASLIYMIGHGASSANNTHYAGYDCGACSGRPGSVNARAFSFMANHHAVRKNLAERGISIPEETEFLGGLHDTTRDEFIFYDEGFLSDANAALHRKNTVLFEKALTLNAKERARRFLSVDLKQSPEQIHEEVKKRSVSLFEPRPELNHATNALCVVGQKWLKKNLFLDRRAFFNSYDYKIDPNGAYLTNILNAATPVCGGINLEYYFSRVDNEKLGAGTKLPHNVMGLIGVANGFEGDLRTGLPLQMVEVHDPLRLMMIVEHLPEVVNKVIPKNPATYEWFINNWVKLVVVHPITKEMYLFEDGVFLVYKPIANSVPIINDVSKVVEVWRENLPIYRYN